MVLSNDLKKAICFGLIIGAIISFCGLCFASEDVDIVYGSGLGVSSSAPYTIISGSYYQYLYFKLEEGVTYVITTNSSVVYGFVEDVPNVRS